MKLRMLCRYTVMLAMKHQTHLVKHEYFQYSILLQILDGSRVHPETYEWARKMAVDALEVR